MNKTLTRLSIIGAIVLMALFAFALLTQEVKVAHASAPSGLPAAVATTSTRVVGPTVALNSYLFGSTTNETALQCESRVITTRGDSAIMLSFSSLGSTTLSGAVGAWQAASTTAVYDSGLYGCGYWTAYAYATTTVTISETR